MEFGPAGAGDLSALVSIDANSPQPWSAAAFAAEFDREPATLFVVRSSVRVLGFISTRIHGPEMDIVNVAVAVEHRRRGVGRLLVGQALDMAARAGVRRAFLEVREGNRAALKLYEALGFKEIQRRRAFYKEPVEDAILMGLQIEP